VDKKWILEKKVNAITVVLFLIGMMILIWFDWLPIWAAASASLFVSITIRQFIIGRIIDVFVSMIFFALLFVSNSLYYSELSSGVILIAGAGYIFIRQCFDLYAFKEKREALAENTLCKEEATHLDPEDPGD
jgi:uncharacterized membrane protein YdfJ with MMPL/SSD domain